jgi:hypothetical protein
MTVSRYVWPSDEDGRGSTRSTWMSENLCAGIVMAWRGATCCVWTFPCWHCWQSRHMAATSLAMPFQTKCAAIVRHVARIPGWATLWMAWNTAALSASGTSGLVIQRATSHSRLAPSTWTVLTVREGDLVACSVLGQLVWLTAILGKEMPEAGWWLHLNHTSCHAN